MSNQNQQLSKEILEKHKALMREMNERLDKLSVHEPEGASVVKTAGVIHPLKEETWER